MLTRVEPVAFLATTNPEGTIQFFRDTLGLGLVEDGPFAIVFRLGRVHLRVQKVERVIEAPYTSLGWRVAKIAPEVRLLARRGVRFERWPGMEQDADGIWTAPGGARVAWFRDPEGQLLSLTEYPAPRRKPAKSRRTRGSTRRDTSRSSR